MEDDRLGLVSASNFDVCAHCPGQRQLLAALNLPDEESDAYSELGTAIHRARELLDPSELDEEGREIYERGIETEKAVLDKWLQDLSLSHYSEGPREIRLWLHDDNLNPVTSGKLDVHYVAGPVLICDWKALWSPNLTPAERNWQGMVQSVLVAEEYGAQHVRMVFVKAMWGSTDSVDYDETALRHARATIFQRAWEAKQPGAPRRPGNWCGKCGCKAHCPEAAAFSLLPLTVAAKGWPEATVFSPALAVAALPIEGVAKLWRTHTPIEHVLEACKKRLKALPKDELERLGFKVGQGRKLNPITDTYSAFQAVLPYANESGLTENELWSILKLSKEKLMDILHHAGVSKSEAKTKIETILAPFVTHEARAEGSLEEV